MELMNDASAINCKLGVFETKTDGIRYSQLSQSYPRRLNMKSRGNFLKREKAKTVGLAVGIADTAPYYRQSRIRCRLPSSRRLLVSLRVN
jgi:hypothetical protein